MFFRASGGEIGPASAQIWGGQYIVIVARGQNVARLSYLAVKKFWTVVETARDRSEIDRHRFVVPVCGHCGRLGSSLGVDSGPKSFSFGAGSLNVFRFILAHPRLVGITLRAEAPQSFEVPLRSLGRRRESLRPGQRRPSGNRNTGGRRSVGTRNHTPVDVGTLPDLCFAWFGTALSSIRFEI